MPTLWRVLLPLAAIAAIREIRAYRRVSDIPTEALAHHQAMEMYQKLAAHIGRRAIDAELRYQEAITR